jgi:hypothetical protein
MSNNALSQSERLLKKWQYLATAIVNLATITIAVFALFYSCKANRIAEGAQRASEKQFIGINRPLLTFTPMRLDGWFVNPTNDGNRVSGRVKYEMKNVGSVIARNITFPKIMVKTGTNLVPAEAERLNPLNLAPGANLFFELRYQSSYSSVEQAAALVAGFSSNFVEMSIPLYYILHAWTRHEQSLYDSKTG